MSIYKAHNVKRARAEVLHLTGCSKWFFGGRIYQLFLGCIPTREPYVISAIDTKYVNSANRNIISLCMHHCNITTVI